MRRLMVIVLVSFTLADLATGQVKRQFSVERKEECEKVVLKLKAKTGNCFIRPSQNEDILNVYSNQDLEEYGHSFSNEVLGKICKVKLYLEQEGNAGVGQKLSYKMFGEKEQATEKFWKVYLAETTPYILDLDYGLGNANIDLSGLAIEKLKINTGSADVNIGYVTAIANKVDMDTFMIKVDVGSVNANQLNLAKPKVVIAEVGFGNMHLDFSNPPVSGNHIISSVGAGNLIIDIPAQDVPVLVTISDSWLCSVNLSKSLKKIGPNKFANATYKKENYNKAIVFDLDVSMGKIIFNEK